MTAQEIINTLTLSPAPAWIQQAALLVYPSRRGQAYETTQARYYTEVTVRIETVKKAKRTGKTYTGLQRRRIDLVALIQANKFKYQPIVAGVEIKVDSHDLAGDSKIDDYLPFCDLFYLAAPAALRVESLSKLEELPGVGLLLVDGASRVVIEREPLLKRPDDTRLKEIFAELLIKPFRNNSKTLGIT